MKIRIKPWPWGPPEKVCKIPAELGAVTKLEGKDGKLVAHTASGVTLIISPESPLWSVRSP